MEVVIEALTNFYERALALSITLGIAIVIFLALQVAVFIAYRIIVSIIQAVDSDDGFGVVSVSDNVERALRLIFLMALELSAIVSALRFAGVSGEATLGLGGVVGLIIAVSSKTIIMAFAGGVYALWSKTVKIGEWISVESASGFVEDIGLIKTTLSDPATGQEIVLANNQFWEDPSLIISGESMNHTLKLDCNPDSVTEVGNIAKSWASMNPYIDGEPAWVSLPGSEMDGSGVPMIISMPISSTADATLKENWIGSVRYASDNPLSEAIYTRGFELSVFDIAITNPKLTVEQIKTAAPRRSRSTAAK